MGLVCFTGTAQPIEPGTYAAGYFDGANAVAADMKGATTLEILTAAFDPAIPESHLKSIAEEPAEYQEGFAYGYEANYRRKLIESPGLRRGLFLVLLGSQLLLFATLLMTGT